MPHTRPKHCYYHKLAFCTHTPPSNADSLSATTSNSASIAVDILMDMPLPYTIPIGNVVARGLYTNVDVATVSLDDFNLRPGEGLAFRANVKIFGQDTNTQRCAYAVDEGLRNPRMCVANEMI